MKMHFITISTDDSRVANLKKTANFFDVNFHCISPTNWKTNLSKLFTMKEFVTNLDNDDVVLFVDAYDVIVTNKMDDVLNRFLSFECDFLCSAELNAWPKKGHGRFRRLYKHEDSLNIFPNIGTYIGKVSALKHFYSWKTYDQIKTGQGHKQLLSDQAYFTDYFMSNYKSEKLKLDIHSEIFQNMHNLNWDELEFVNGELHNKIFDTKPVLMHFSGGSENYELENGKLLLSYLSEKIIESNYSNIQPLVDCQMNELQKKRIKPQTKQR